MDLIESLKDQETVRGITLNSQLIDLFSIIEQSTTEDEAKQKIYEYLSKILQANSTYKKMSSKNMTVEEKIKNVCRNGRGCNGQRKTFRIFIKK